MSEVTIQNIAVVVLSCDKYSDLWSPFTTLFEKFWPSCPFKKYLFSNLKPATLPGFTSILSGPDVDWTSSLLSCLNQISEKYVILFFDDVLLCSSVTAESESKLIQIFKKYEPDYFRFRPYPQPSQWVEKNVGYFKVDEAYRTALFAAWKVEVLKNILVPGESAWSFEMQSVSRAKNFKNFLGTNHDFFPYVHGVEKGKWYRSAVKFAQKNSIQLDLAYRSVMTWTEDLQSRFRHFRGFIYILLPKAIQPEILKLSGFVRKKIWYKW